MALFKRKKKNSVVLPELEKYYEAERRERSGLAWILALISVAGVALVLIGAFIGGRWIYRQNKNDKPATVAVVQKDDTKAKTDKKNEPTKQNTNNTVTTPQSPTPSTPSTPSTSAPAPSSPVAPATPTSVPTAPATGNTGQLVNTGPESVIPAFMTATALGMFLYRRKLRANY